MKTFKGAKEGRIVEFQELSIFLDEANVSDNEQVIGGWTIELCTYKL
jgi:hypothetical protein